MWKRTEIWFVKAYFKSVDKSHSRYQDQLQTEQQENWWVERITEKKDSLWVKQNNVVILKIPSKKLTMS